MSKIKIRYFTAGLTVLFIVILVGATTAIAKADTEEITQGIENPTQVIAASTIIDNQPESPEITVCISTETTDVAGTDLITATDLPTNVETTEPAATDTAPVLDSPTDTETSTDTPTPTEITDTQPPKIQFSTDDVSGGQIKIRISVSDESGVDGQSLSGQATDGNGSVQTCSFAENSGQYTCLLTLGNGNYRVVVSTKDLAGNSANVDLPDFTVQINSVN
jgi:hypothetical protein